ncbi:MAG TPA: hypothetical protein VG714_06870, partial [Acidobacteriaceae bacterium]|nr:hypothetical protein [Acidobacteriaceae bacterium]
MMWSRAIAGLGLSFAMCAMCAGQTAAAGDSSARWSAPAAELARQIAAIAGPGPATLAVENAASVAKEDVAAIRRLLAADLQAGGVNVRAAAEGAAIPTAVKVTLSENARGG